MCPHNIEVPALHTVGGGGVDMLFSNQHFCLITRQVTIVATTARRNERMAGEEGEQTHLQHCVVFQCNSCNQTRGMECAIFRPDDVHT